MTTKTSIPAFATHPGEILLDEINANNFSQIDFAKMIGMSRTQLNEIIKGKRNINADLALLLEEALGVDAEYWMEAQKNHDLDKARIEARNRQQLEAMEVWKVAKDFIPVPFFKKEKIITGNPLTDNQIIRDIYDVSNLDQLAALRVQDAYARFKKSTKLKYDLVHIMGWVKLVQYKAKKITVPAFHHDSKDSLVEELKAIILKNKNTLDRVQSKLNEYGIKLIYQSKGEKTPVDGVSFWSEGNPTIGMTLRHKRLDNFAFTLFHELGHIYEHLVNNNEVEFIDLDDKNEEEEYKKSTEEKEANFFAQNNLIDQKEWEEFSRNLEVENNDASIIAFATKIETHPCIVRGRVCYTLNKYKSFTKINHDIN